MGKKLPLTVLLAPMALAVCGPARASVTLPDQKPGLWQSSMIMHMKMTINGQASDDMDNTPMVSEMCASAATQAATMRMLTGGGGKCLQMDIEKSGDTYTFDASCADPMGGTTPMTTHGTMTILSDEAYHMTSQTKGAEMSGDMVGDSKWLGDCPAGMVPGDFGRVVNGAFNKEGNLLDTPPGQ